jgi:uncharacterized radical SAM superfamily Fe-S cluster-containing enzyme
LSKGDARNGCCPGGTCGSADGSAAGTLGRNANGRGDGPFETLSTCLALIEIVNSCNLSCPTCYADSPLGSGHALDAAPLTDLQARIQGVIDRKGRIEILQLSGGEPTCTRSSSNWCAGPRPILALTTSAEHQRRPDRKDDGFIEELGRTFRYGGMQLYLQFDGPQEAGQRAPCR